MDGGIALLILLALVVVGAQLRVFLPFFNSLV